MVRNPEIGEPKVEGRETKPLNEENWKILKREEAELLADIRPLGRTPEGHAYTDKYEKRRELMLQLVRVRQMMREEMQKPDLQFEQIEENFWL